MLNSTNFNFPYLIAAQTQKHLSVNNALARLDACAQLIVRNIASDEIENYQDGEVYLIKEDANNFVGHGGQIGLFLNGGFEYLDPRKGWRAYFSHHDGEFIYDGQSWVSNVKTTIEKSIIDYDIANDSAPMILEKSIVFGVSARVIEAFSGTATSWKMGIAGDDARYGNGLWMGLNGWAKSLTGSPITYWQDTPLQIEGEGGTISTGKVRLHIYSLELDVPDEI